MSQIMKDFVVIVKIFSFILMYKSVLTIDIKIMFLFVKSQLYFMHIDVTLYVYNGRGPSQTGGCI